MVGKTYIFLDYDGVVACARECSKKTFKKLNPGNSFVPEAITHLNRLVSALEEDGRNVRVVPITNRLRWIPVKHICRSLRDAGFEGQIQDDIGAFKKKYFGKQFAAPRGKALNKWCEKHLESEDDYIILDNNHPKKLPDKMKSHLVKIDRYAKLTAEDVDKALEILGAERKKPEAAADVAEEYPHAGTLHRDRQKDREKSARCR